MSTLLSYNISPYTPFTKILSANANQDKTDIQNRLNWSAIAGDATTGLSGDNIQSQSAVTAVNATVTTQGITLTAIAGQGSNGNSITIAFTSGGVAGSEIVSVVGQAISVQIASGTSTVTQVVTALQASSSPSVYLVTASGSSASTVSTASAVNLSGGVSAGGLVRSTKLGLDTANYVVINNSSGQMSSEASLNTSRGGTGLNVIPANQQPGDVFQVNSSKTAVVLSAPIGVSASLRLYQFTNL